MFGDVESMMYPVNSSIPQRSFLGLLNSLHTPRTSLKSCTNISYVIRFTPMTSSCMLTLRSKMSILLQLQNCVTDVREWCTSRRLLLNDDKTELVWFGSRSNLTKLACSDCSVLVGSNILKTSTTVRDLGALPNIELSLNQHVNKVVSSAITTSAVCDKSIAVFGRMSWKKLASVFILSRLKYCYSILTGPPKSTIATLQCVQKAAARMVLNLRPRDSMA